MTGGAAVVLLAAVGSGLVAGVFHGFSGFVMRALSSLPPEAGAAAVGVLTEGSVDRAGAFVLAGAGAYLAGVVGVTVVANVPLNDRLAATGPADATEAAVWADYTRRWTRWNTVRTVAGMLAAAALAGSSGA